jgi:hypothetical protein
MTTDEINEIERIAKIVRPTPQDTMVIWELYKTHINANAAYPSNSGCSTCGSSIVRYWRELMNWWNNNKQNYITE